MNISLPDPMRDWVQTQIETGKYSSSSDYIRDLIRRDQEDRNKLLILQHAISEGLASGVSTQSMEELLQEAKKQLISGNNAL